MFDHNMVREILYGIGIIVALGAPPWPSPITGWLWGRWVICVLIVVLLFMMLVR